MFRVEWTPEALNDLAGVWMVADQDARRAIIGATNRIDEQFASDPFGTSESRSDDLRILFESPLGVSFEVDETHGVVQVVGVWFVRKRGR
ncbi:MAG TPA: hypothetical protein VG406_05275 [Isosphaeraceae bacterium]|jgi:hypothetical protein|nr:hypothetical protein [Isosphaeraceae bacterium]